MAPITVLIEPLTPRSFAPFGTVIQNPARTGDPTTGGEEANQGTAVKYADISALESHYQLAPSGKPGRPSLTLFACGPRPLRREARAAMMDVRMLERHPYTTQTFVPLGAAPRDRRASCYVVVVAPTTTRPREEQPAEETGGAGAFPTAADVVGEITRGRPAPFTNGLGPSVRPLLAGRRPQQHTDRPDVGKVRAFLGRGDQAVTYAAGTWHAPMAVVGRRPVDFVVCQFVNGVGEEDCEEVELQERLAVDVGSVGARLARL
jgi:ureidoglycolate lyase